MTVGMMMMKMMKRFPLTGLLVCCACATSGCSSVMSHTGASQGYYPGTRASAETIVDKNSGWVMKPLAAIDLPFSAVLDTLLLPMDYYRSGDKGEDDSPRARVLRSEQANHTDAIMNETIAPMSSSHDAAPSPASGASHAPAR